MVSLNGPGETEGIVMHHHFFQGGQLLFVFGVIVLLIVLFWSLGSRDYH